MFKLVNNLESVSFTQGINYSCNNRLRNYNLRSHDKSLVREQVRNCLPRYNFFVNRVANKWNELPAEVVNAKNLNVFKAKLDEWMSSQTKRLL